MGLVRSGTLLAAIGLFVLVGVGSRAAQHSAPEALRGLDPVLLARGESQPGREEFSVIHQGFWYRFVSAESRDTFRQDPAAFEIRLGGVCARMGGLTAGDPEIFAVHDGRIYLFSNEDCRRRFQSAPDRYLLPVGSLRVPAASAAARAREALELAASRMGAVDDLEGYRLHSAYRHRVPQGQVLMEVEILLRFDGYFRRVERRPFGPLAMVLAPGGGFTETLGRRHPLNEGQRAYLDRLRRRQLPVLLWARRAPDLRASLKGGTVVEIDWGGTRTQVLLRPDGDVEALSYWGRGPEGLVGRILEHFSDYRTADGLRLPHRIDATWNGEPDVGRSLEIPAWRMRPPPVEDFVRPLAGPLGSSPVP